MPDIVVAATPGLVDVGHEDLVKLANIYMNKEVVGGSRNTIKAKGSDLTKFLDYFTKKTGGYELDRWHTSITRDFQKALAAGGYSAVTVNRVVATLRHFASWVGHTEAGREWPNPTANVKDLQVDFPEWNGLNDQELGAIYTACDDRMRLHGVNNRNVLRDTAVIYLLAHTGLRVGEMCRLNMGQYHGASLSNVQRKGNKISRVVPVPAAARERVDAYIDDRKGARYVAKGFQADKSEALFHCGRGGRLSTASVSNICKTIAIHAKTWHDTEIRLTPHMLRHTFLKRIADAHGVHFAQKVSGNISIKEIFRYTAPSDKEVAVKVEDVYKI